MTENAAATSSQAIDGPPAAKKTKDVAALGQPSTSTASDPPARKARLLSTISLSKIGGVVEGRIESKTPITPWLSREGKLFAFVMRDESASIQVVAFNEAADQYFDKIKVENCVRVSGFKVKRANPRFKMTDHDFDLVLTRSTVIRSIAGDHLPQVSRSFTTVADISKVEVNRIIDVIGVVFDMDKRENRASAQLVDNNIKIITLTLWEGKTHILDGLARKIVGLRNVQVRDFEGLKTLSSTPSTEAVLTLNTQTKHAIQDWWNNGGHEDEFEGIPAAPSANK